MGKQLRLYVARLTDTEVKVGVSVNPYKRVVQVKGELIFQTDFMHPQLALDIEYQVKRMLAPYWSRPNDYEIFEVSAGALLNTVQAAIALETNEGRPNGKLDKKPPRYWKSTNKGKREPFEGLIADTPLDEVEIDDE